MVINQIPAILDYRLKKKNKKVTPVERVQPTSYYKNQYEYNIIDIFITSLILLYTTKYYYISRVILK